MYTDLSQNRKRAKNRNKRKEEKREKERKAKPKPKEEKKQENRENRRNLDIKCQAFGLNFLVETGVRVVNCSGHSSPVSMNFLEISRNFVEMSRNFPEISRNFLEISKNFPEKSRKFLNISTKFLEISRNFLEIRLGWIFSSGVCFWTGWFTFARVEPERHENERRNWLTPYSLNRLCEYYLIGFVGFFPIFSG